LYSFIMFMIVFHLVVHWAGACLGKH
jgi:hypothetical protein